MRYSILRMHYMFEIIKILFLENPEVSRTNLKIN